MSYLYGLFINRYKRCNFTCCFVVDDEKLRFESDMIRFVVLYFVLKYVLEASYSILLMDNGNRHGAVGYLDS